MQRKLKFKDDIPVFIWLGNRGIPKTAKYIEYTNGQKIAVEEIKPESYYYAMERIIISSKTFSHSDAEKFMYALCQYLDEDDEDNFFLLLMDFNKWHEVLVNEK